MTSAFLGVDIGTSSCKALLMAPSGEVLATETVDYPLSTLKQGWSEQNPEDWVAGASKAIAAVVGRSRQMHGMTKTRVINASGGGASSSLWNQMQADMFNAEVITTKSAAEGGAYGAAMLAAVGIGHWRNIDEAAEVCTADKRWTPDAGRHAAYAELFEIYRTLYGALTEANNRLSAFVAESR